MKKRRHYIRLRILHIEDEAAIGSLVEKFMAFSYFDVELVRVSTLQEGLQRLREDRWDLILLDLSLPDSEPANTFPALYKAHPYTPVIVLTAEVDLEIRARTIAQGAQDCLYKMELKSPDTLARSIRFAVERHRLLLELREIIRELEEFKRQFLELTPDFSIKAPRKH